MKTEKSPILSKARIKEIVSKRKRLVDNADAPKKSDDKSATKTKKGRGRKQKKKNYYFDMAVQEKIVEYQKSDCLKEKSKIYEQSICPAFTELVKSLVSVYGFKSSNEDIEHLKSDCVTFYLKQSTNGILRKTPKLFHISTLLQKIG